MGTAKRKDSAATAIFCASSTMRQQRPRSALPRRLCSAWTRYSTPILCNMAISCFGKVGRWREALDLYRRMEPQLGHRPNSMTYGVLINALGTVSSRKPRRSRRVHTVVSGVNDDGGPGTTGMCPGISGPGSKCRGFSARALFCVRMKWGHETWVRLLRLLVLKCDVEGGFDSSRRVPLAPEVASLCPRTVQPSVHILTVVRSVEEADLGGREG